MYEKTISNNFSRNLGGDLNLSTFILYVCKGIKVLLLYSAIRTDLTPGRGLTQPWFEPSP